MMCLSMFFIGNSSVIGEKGPYVDSGTCFVGSCVHLSSLPPRTRSFILTRA